ncbi:MULTISPECIES: hypothetical protein [unclassified Acinetobacter]|uniref:hypothetical protein n=1 Tax=unclassified Acinetobacter TaxID=196816 RepID=UPI002934D295|nr:MULTISPECIES: hypothetical protein [unclassified Acinetobacter]WOE33307.1 hypothetical protein QSG84_15535 [Acinetobacter sp. SAAs470]WOE37034.1 hypothetical protein QSG86_00625 [Acinetobacter sp. SAAs474]
MINKSIKNNNIDSVINNIIVNLSEDKIIEWTEQGALGVTPHLAYCPNYIIQPPVIPLRMIAYEDMTSEKVI